MKSLCSSGISQLAHQSSKIVPPLSSGREGTKPLPPKKVEPVPASENGSPSQVPASVLVSGHQSSSQDSGLIPLSSPAASDFSADNEPELREVVIPKEGMANLGE